jgi:hypothetical protein
MSDLGGRAERRMLEGMHRLGLLPADLLASSAWQALVTVPTAARSPLRLRLVLAWSERDRQPLVWASAWRTALAMQGDNGGRKAWLFS